MNLIDINEAARLLGLKKSWIYELTSKGLIPHYKVRPTKFGRLRFSPDKLKKWVELRAIPVRAGKLASLSGEIETVAKPKPWGWMPGNE